MGSLSASRAALAGAVVQAVGTRVMVPPAPRRFPAMRWLGPGVGYAEAGAFVQLLQEQWNQVGGTPGHLDDVTDRMYIEMFRLDQATFYMVCNEYGHLWRKDATRVGNTVSVEWRLAIYLCWMAFGVSQRTLEHLFGVSDSLVSEICNDLTYVFSERVYLDFVRLPVKDDMIANEARNRTKWKLPNCIYSVDGSFFHILQPLDDVIAFYCYKKFYAILIMAVVDSNFKFVEFITGVPGSVGDAATWNACSFNRQLRTTQRYDIDPVYIAPDGNLVGPTAPGAVRIDSYVVADAAFGLTRRCIKCVPDDGTDADKERLNTRITNIRRGSEMAFARYSGRWKIVKWNNISDPDFATEVSRAAAALHNICQTRSTVYRDGWQDETDPRRIQVQQQRATAVRAEQQRLNMAAARPVLNPGSRRDLADGERVRNALLAYARVHR